MKTDKIIIANLKCTGCATTIETEMQKIKGVSAAKVDVENDAVIVTYKNGAREAIVARLHGLGYPEATDENGLLLQLKSYASCMIGKVSNLRHHEKKTGNRDDLEKLIHEGRATIVDVRTAAEYRKGSVMGAINVPLPQLPQRLKELKKMPGPLVLCCASGNRSAQAQKYLAMEGIVCINGGSWQTVNEVLAA